MPPLKVAVQVTDWFTVGEAGEQLTLSTTGACTAVATVRVTESVSLPAALVAVSETVLEPADLKLVKYVPLLPGPGTPPLQTKEAGAPPLRVAVQATGRFTVGDEGEQLMLSITGACPAVATVTVIESLSLPPSLVTVSEMVLEPAELKLVSYVVLLLLDGPPLQA